MFHSVRIKNWKLTLSSVVCFLILLTVCLLMLRAAPRDSVTVGDEQVGVKIDDDGDIEAFIARCGYTVEGCVSDEEITVPKTWNDVYSAYNELQQQQGFDLRPYKGRSARKVVYALADGAGYVTVLTSGGRIIAADITSTQQSESPKPLIP